MEESIPTTHMIRVRLFYRRRTPVTAFVHFTDKTLTVDTREIAHRLGFMNGASLLLLSTALDRIIGRELSCMGGSPE